MNWFKIFISGAVAFGMSIAVTVLIENLGGALGSIIATIPSTIIPGVVIILTEEGRTMDQRYDAIIACLYGMFGTCILFMPCWKVVPPLLPRKWTNGARIVASVVISLVVWFTGAMVLILLQGVFNSMGMSTITYGILIMVVSVICGVCFCWYLPPTPAGKNKVKWYIYLARGFMASCSIFISGILSQTSSGAAAGAMSTFPAMFLTTMVSVSISQGPEVAVGAIGPLMMGGLVGGWYSLYTILASKVLSLGAAASNVFAFIMCILFWNIPFYFFVFWRRRATEEKTRRMVKEAAGEKGLEMKSEIEMSDVKPVEFSNNDDSIEQIADEAVVATHEAVETKMG